MSKYSNLTYRCIKGQRIDEVVTRTLFEIGFPIDAPKDEVEYSKAALRSYTNKIYHSNYSVVGLVEKIYVRELICCRDKDKAIETVLSELNELEITDDELISELKRNRVFFFSADEAETMVDEFIYIIQTMLPRKLSDIYYCFDIQPNPTYHIFFDLAAEKIGLKKYDDPYKSNFGNFIGFPSEDEVKKRIISGDSLQDIYMQTCITKQDIKNAVSGLTYSDIEQLDTTYNIFRIEKSLFNLSSKYKYFKNVNIDGESFDYLLCVDGQPVLTIYYADKNFYDNTGNRIKDKKTKNIPCLCIDFLEIENCYLLNLIKKALTNDAYVALHNKERDQNFIYEYASVFGICDREATKASTFCGCFYCGRIFKSEEITEFTYEGKALCPYCEDKTVIADSTGYSITSKFLEKVSKCAEWLDLYDEEY